MSLGGIIALEFMLVKSEVTRVLTLGRAKAKSWTGFIVNKYRPILDSSEPTQLLTGGNFGSDTDFLWWLSRSFKWDFSSLNSISHYKLYFATQSCAEYPRANRAGRERKSGFAPQRRFNNIHVYKWFLFVQLIASRRGIK